MASSSDILEEQYEAQIFGFSPSMFLEGVKGLILDRLCEAVDQLKGQLSKVPEEILPPDEVEQGINTLRHQTDKNFTKTFQKFELHVLDSVMKVPQHILLPTDVEQVSQYSDTDIKTLKTEIEELQVQCKNEKYMQAKLKEELQDISLVLREQKMFLDNTINGPKMTRIEEAKEKLLYNRSISEETQSVVARVQEAAEYLKMEGGTKSDQLLVTEISQ
ncbi:protein MIS12 homolog [Procambarus clarkii]|uniref:protein MIS12 homolog n=1 Tax=Procambarus clarkii TaxID=6728 RepID=UPI001E671D08|nr:protein MIS12 homolog [Procambarus clarkii]